jgi:hypothetical protein
MSSTMPAKGQRGNQRLDGANGAILHHKEEGLSLRVFWGSAGVVEYAGEFGIDDRDPWYPAQAPETGDGPMRQVVMFRLHPLGAPTAAHPQRPNRRIVRSRLATPYRHVDPTQASTPRDPFAVDPDAIDRGLRGHKLTQETLAEFAKHQQCEVLSPGDLDPHFDLAWRRGQTVTIVEVKSLTGANESGQIRLGLGQVLDYQHQLELTGEPVHAVLAVEHSPGDSRWQLLCARHNVTLVWPENFQTLFAAE